MECNTKSSPHLRSGCESTKWNISLKCRNTSCKSNCRSRTTQGTLLTATAVRFCRYFVPFNYLVMATYVINTSLLRMLTLNILLLCIIHNYRAIKIQPTVRCIQFKRPITLVSKTHVNRGDPSWETKHLWANYTLHILNFRQRQRWLFGMNRSWLAWAITVIMEKELHAPPVLSD